MTALAARRSPASATSPLFPSRAEREQWDDLLTRELLTAGERLANRPVAPTIDLDKFRRELGGFDFHAPAPLGQVLGWTVAQLERGVTQVTNPRYFGLFNPAPTFPAQCADRIAAAFNPQLATATTSPAAVEIEAHVIQAVVRRAGLPPDATGHFTTGGAEANYTALICALTRAEPRFAEKGSRAFAGAAGILCLAREPSRVVQDRASGRDRPGSGAIGRNRWRRPDGTARARGNDRGRPHGGHGAGDDRRYCRHHQCRDDRSAR